MTTIRRLHLYDPQPNWHLSSGSRFIGDSVAFDGGKIITSNYLAADGISRTTTLGDWGTYTVQHRAVDTGIPYLTTNYTPSSSHPAPDIGGIIKCCNDPEAWYMSYNGPDGIHALFFRNGTQVSTKSKTTEKSSVAEPDRPFHFMRLRDGRKAYFICGTDYTNHPTDTHPYIRRVIDLAPSPTDLKVRIGADGVGSTGANIFVDRNSNHVWFATLSPASFGGGSSVISNPCGYAKFDENLNLLQEWPLTAEKVGFDHVICGNEMTYWDDSLISSDILFSAVLRKVQIQVSQPFPEIERFNFVLASTGVAAGEVSGPVDFGNGLMWLQDGICQFCEHQPPSAVMIGC